MVGSSNGGFRLKGTPYLLPELLFGLDECTNGPFLSVARGGCFSLDSIIVIGIADCLLNHFAFSSLVSGALVFLGSSALRLIDRLANILAIILKLAFFLAQ